MTVIRNNVAIGDIYVILSL